MHVLVTGGAGFIGSNFVRHLVGTTDHTVTTYDALTYAGSRSNLEGVLESPRHEFVEGDVRDRATVSPRVAAADVVVNFAAETHVDRANEDATPFVRTNVHGTQVLLEAAMETSLDLFVQVSTDEVYGEIPEGSFSEDDPLDPQNPYSATKAGADHLARSYHETHDLSVVVVRPSNNYGPGQHPEKFIPKAILRVSRGEPIPVYGDGSHVREWLYVRDNCRAITTVVERGDVGEVYNVGSGVGLPNVEVAERILDAMDASGDLIEFVEDRPGHDERYSLDTGKIRSLGWEPEWSFERGLEETVDYYVTKRSSARSG